MLVHHNKRAADVAGRSLRGGFPWLCALMVLALPSTRLDAQGINGELVRRAPKIIEFLKTHGYTNVGVLKLQIRKGTDRPTDNAGPLNLDLAHRLTVALIQASDPRDKHHLGIIRDASAVAASLPGADHSTPEGRKVLFEAHYPLAWRAPKVQADAFLTGTVEFSKNLDKMTIRLVCVDRGHAPIPVFDGDHLIHASTDSDSLTDTGESFLLKGGLTLNRVAARDDDPIAVAQAVRTVREDPNDRFCLNDPDRPVDLQIRYDGKKVPITFRDGQWSVPEPSEGQSVDFVLAPTKNASGRYGVVLKVNGLNTRGKERLPPSRCRMWVLAAGDAPHRVGDFWKDDGKREPFAVSSLAQSRQNENRYGADVGTYELVVYPERGPEPRPKSFDVEYARVNDRREATRQASAAVKIGLLPPPAACEDLGSLQATLRSGAWAQKGLVEASGKIVQSKIVLVPFQRAGTPIMSATIHYYRPKAR